MRRIEVDFSLPAERVVRSLNQIIEWRGKQNTIRVDNGPEYISGNLMEWAEKQGVRLEHIQPHAHTCFACDEELLSNLVFEDCRSCGIWLGLMGSIPSLNVTPVMTLAR